LESKRKLVLREKIQNLQIKKLVRHLSEILVKNLAKMSKNKNFFVAIFAVICVLSLLSAAIVIKSSPEILSFGNKGLINTLTTAGSLKVYWDSNLTNTVSTIDWGTIPPGGFGAITIYVQNTASAPVTLTLSATDWNPTSCVSYMTLIWDYTQGQEIPAGQSVKVIITLKVSTNITGIANFNFNTLIYGEES
jgi:hypothetical protein